jgi:hypothetical protein
LAAARGTRAARRPGALTLGAMAQAEP